MQIYNLVKNVCENDAVLNFYYISIVTDNDHYLHGERKTMEKKIFSIFCVENVCEKQRLKKSDTLLVSASGLERERRKKKVKNKKDKMQKIKKQNKKKTAFAMLIVIFAITNVPNVSVKINKKLGLESNKEAIVTQDDCLGNTDGNISIIDYTIELKIEGQAKGTEDQEYTIDRYLYNYISSSDDYEQR